MKRDMRVKKPFLFNNCFLRDARLVSARAILAHDHGRRGVSVASGLWNRVLRECWVLDVGRFWSEFVKSCTTGNQ